MQIRWTKQALGDLTNARAFGAAHHPDSVAAFAAQVRSSLDVLKAHPGIGRDGRVDGTRELAIPRTPFLLVYRVEGKHLDILAFLHGSRRWPEA